MNFDEQLGSYLQAVNEGFIVILTSLKNMQDKIDEIVKDVSEIDADVERLMVVQHSEKQWKRELNSDIFTIAQILADIQNCSLAEIIPTSY